MLTLHLSLALIAVGAMAAAPRSGLATLVVAAAAAVDVAFGAAALPALRVALPILVFLSAALTLAALTERAGLADLLARRLAVAGGGSFPRLYALVCLLTAALTAVVSLDGAVVLVVPLLRRLAGSTATAFGPLFLAAVAVANAVSIAVPQGNPTNLVVIERLGLSSSAERSPAGTRSHYAGSNRSPAASAGPRLRSRAPASPPGLLPL